MLTKQKHFKPGKYTKHNYQIINTKTKSYSFYSTSSLGKLSNVETTIQTKCSIIESNHIYLQLQQLQLQQTLTAW